MSYDIICLDCDNDNKFDDKYISETANTGYTRGEEHLNDLRNGRDGLRAYDRETQRSKAQFSDERDRVVLKRYYVITNIRGH